MSKRSRVIPGAIAGLRRTQGGSLDFIFQAALLQDLDERGLVLLVVIALYSLRREEKLRCIVGNF